MKLQGLGECCNSMIVFCEVFETAQMLTSYWWKISSFRGKNIRSPAISRNLQFLVILLLFTFGNFLWGLRLASTILASKEWFRLQDFSAQSAEGVISVNFSNFSQISFLKNEIKFPNSDILGWKSFREVSWKVFLSEKLFLKTEGVAAFVKGQYLS